MTALVCARADSSPTAGDVKFPPLPGRIDGLDKSRSSIPDLQPRYVISTHNTLAENTLSTKPLTTQRTYISSLTYGRGPGDARLARLIQIQRCRITLLVSRVPFAPAYSSFGRDLRTEIKQYVFMNENRMIVDYRKVLKPI